jgi:putative tryptophan/tyrosine transport system substrate-binding protein
MRPTRRTLLIASAALFAARVPALGQSPARLPRIAFLSLNTAANPTGLDSFLEGLRALGYVDGKTIVIEYGDAGGDLSRFPALVADVIAKRVAVIVAPNVSAAQAARRATSRIPIVFAGLTDPVADGLVASLAHPGGNITGLSNLSPELIGKRLEILKEAIRRMAHVALLWQPGGGGEGTSHKATIERAESAARALRIKLDVVEVRAANDIDHAFAEMSKRRVDGFTVLGTPMFFLARARLTELAARGRLPAIYSTRQYVDHGGLMSYGASLDDLLRRCAGYVDRILKGANPADIPVEQPARFELVINARTARSLGIDIAASVRNRADRVID